MITGLKRTSCGLAADWLRTGRGLPPGRAGHRAGPPEAALPARRVARSGPSERYGVCGLDRPDAISRRRPQVAPLRSIRSISARDQRPPQPLSDSMRKRHAGAIRSGPPIAAWAVVDA